MEILTLYIDGASRGNPGDAGIGVLLLNQDGDAVGQVSEYIGKATNNVAEYQALIAGLKEAKSFSIRQKQTYGLVVRTDSELIAKQLTGHFRVRDKKLIPLSLRAMNLLKSFGTWKFVHVSRRENRRADNLANLAIDGAIEERSRAKPGDGEGTPPLRRV